MGGKAMGGEEQLMFRINRVGRLCGEVLRQNVMCFEEEGQPVEMEYLTFPSLEDTGIVNHLFTTRTGGVSEGIYASLNLSFSRGDDSERVLHNFARVGKTLGCPAEHMTASDQTHTTHIRRVTKADRGKGVTIPRDYEEIDGLITDESGIALATFYADCVPLYFVDPEHRAIGLAHSGWRGTVGRMGERMAEEMGKQFGSRPEKLIAAIGPAICQDCYEVSEEVASAFEELVKGAGELLEEIAQSGCYADRDHKRREVIAPGREPGKYQLDLWLANALILRQAGIPLNQIAIADICTCHNASYLFSHRASQGKRGNLGAFLMLK